MTRKKKTLKEMTDGEMYAMLQEFGQRQSVAIGGHIKVTVTQWEIGFTPEPGYEDSEYLRDIIRGAASFLYWIRRQGKTIR